MRPFRPSVVSLKLLTASGLALSALAAGCTPPVEGIRGPVPVPNTYAFSQNTQPARISRWWTRFGSQELDRLVETANFANLDIAIAVSQLRAADAQAQITAAALFPSLTYKRQQRAHTVVRHKCPGRRDHASHPQLVHQSYQRQLRARRLGAEPGRARSFHPNGHGECVPDRSGSPHRHCEPGQQLPHLRRKPTARDGGDAEPCQCRSILRAIQDRLAAGTASELDVVQQQALVESQRASIALLRQSADAARVLVASLLGTNPQAVPLAIRSARSLRVPVSSPGVPASVLVRRPDVRAQEQQLLAADANVEVARKAFLPNIQLTGQAGYQSAALSTLLRPESVIWQAAASLTQPIFDGGRLRGQLVLSEAQRQQLLDTYRRSIITALTDVETALVAVRETRLREIAQTAAVRAARRAFELSQQRLREGTVDLTSILSVQNTLFQAEDILIQVRLTRLQAAVSLFQALGGDWDESVITVSGIP